MILTSLIIGAAIAGLSAITFWKDLAYWLKIGWEKLPESLKKDLKGVVTSVINKAGTIFNIIKYYSYNQNKNQWSETIVRKECSINDVPQHIRNRITYGSEIDTTQELKEKLELSL
ncbi:hypothetical protein ACTXKB_13990 [Psychrobacter aquimaris]|uniref:hypothetical protein n=1 Tax=Psychrobacter aquimaris TaxID=292733 RepID=UPI003FD3D881